VAHFGHQFQTWCERSSIHGLLEIRHAQSLKWTLFWTIVVTGSFGVTFFQVTREIWAFQQDRSLALISPVNPGEGKYFFGIPMSIIISKLFDSFSFVSLGWSTYHFYNCGTIINIFNLVILLLNFDLKITTLKWYCVENWYKNCYKNSLPIVK